MKNKIDRYIEEMTEELFIVEGVITGLLTRETLQNINQKYSSTASGIAVGSALLDQIVSASIANFAASDEGIDVSEFAIEVRDQDGVMHYFKGCFPEVIFKEGDQIKVIAQPFKTEYAYVNAIIDIEKQYIWTSQQVIKGRLRYRIFCLKLTGFATSIGSVLMPMIFLIMDEGLKIFSFSIFSEHEIFFKVLVVVNLLFLLIGWRVGASFDEQSAELEAILNKLNFYKPTMMGLDNFLVSIVNIKNKEFDSQNDERWMEYTYRLDLAKQEDEEKYGNKKQVK